MSKLTAYLRKSLSPKTSPRLIIATWYWSYGFSILHLPSRIIIIGVWGGSSNYFSGGSGAFAFLNLLALPYGSFCFTDLPVLSPPSLLKKLLITSVLDSWTLLGERVYGLSKRSRGALTVDIKPSYMVVGAWPWAPPNLVGWLNTLSTSSSILLQRPS